MKILGIDTSTVTASVALVEEGKLTWEEVSPPSEQSRLCPGAVHRANHAETLLPLMHTVLTKTGVSLPEISALAVSIGPGSFTGLRIGLSTVKGLAYGWDIPVVGVPTLLAVAARVTNWEGLVCPLLDAKKNEVYTALFQKKGSYFLVAVNNGKEDKSANIRLAFPHGKKIKRLQAIDLLTKVKTDYYAHSHLSINFDIPRKDGKVIELKVS